MAPRLIVEIVGDASSLERSFKRSSTAANRFGRDISKASRGAVAANLSFRGLGRSVAFASSSFLGGFGLGLAIKSVVDEMSKQQKVAAQTAAVIKSTGDVSGVTARHVDAYAASLLKVTGIDDEVIKSGENMLLTFTNIRNVTGKNNDIFDQATRVGLDMATALQGAGFEGGNLQTTMIRLGKALNDPVRGITALRRVGVQFTSDQTKLIKRLVETGHTLEAQKIILRELNREFGGSAAAAGQTLAGRLNVLRETAKNLGAAILQQFLPAITKTVNRLTAWISQTQNQNRVLDDVKQATRAVADVFNVLSAAFTDLNRVTGSTRRTLELLLGTFIAFKAIKLVGGVAGLATALGGATTGATTFSGALSGNAGLIALTGAAAFALTTMALNATGADKQLRRLGGAVHDLDVKFHLASDPTAQFKDKLIPKPGDIERFRAQIKKLMDVRNITKGNAIDVFVELHPHVNKHDVEVATRTLDTVQPPAGALGPVAPGPRKAERPGKSIDTGPSRKELTATQARLKASRDAVRQAAQDQAALAVDRAQLTSSLADDLSALQKQNALLKRRIAGGHDTIQILQEQVQVEGQIRQLQQQIAQNKIDRLQFGVDVAAATTGLRDDLQALARLKAFLTRRLQADKGNLDLERQIFAVNQQIAAAQKARRNQRQFRALGLGPTGEDLIPGVKSLKKQLGNIADAVSGSFLDTRKTRGMLAHIRQVLSGGLGSVSSEVRAKIQAMLADLKDQLKQSSVDVTRFQKTATGQFSLAGASPGAHGLTINGGIHLHGVQNVQQLENALAKRKKQRAHARRGTR